MSANTWWKTEAIKRAGWGMGVGGGEEVDLISPQDKTLTFALFFETFRLLETVAHR